MIELVPLQLKYCEDVEKIAKECLPEHWSLAGIQDVLRYDNNIFYIAKDIERGSVIGFVGTMVIVDEAELLNIAVTSAYRKQGIGQQLLDRVVDESKKRGANRLLLEVRRSNLSAIAFYQKNQFVQIGERKNYYAKPLEDAIIMEKPLLVV